LPVALIPRPSYARSPMNHFTDKTGYDGIRSQPRWFFRSSQPRARHQPAGAYFTTYEPNEPNLSIKIFVPRDKLQFLFSFQDTGDLLPLPGGRGRLGRIFYSPDDYRVDEARQQFQGRGDNLHGESGGSNDRWR